MAFGSQSAQVLGVILLLSSNAGFSLAGCCCEKLAQLANKSQITLEERYTRIEDQLAQITAAVNRNEESIDKILCNLSPCQKQNNSLLCRTCAASGEWIVFQQRSKWSVKFDRTWSEYRDGFGDVRQDGDFWWGLEKLHQLTKSGDCELLVELKDAAGEFRFARYSEFGIEGESERYRLAKLSGYSGTAGNFDYFKGQKFSTHDSDNDGKPDSNCASNGGGGWWYKACGYSLNSENKNYVIWNDWKVEPLSYTRMLIRATTNRQISTDAGTEIVDL